MVSCGYNWDNTRNGNRLREDRFLRDLYTPTHVCGFTPKSIRLGGEKVKSVKIITHEAGNPNWYYTNQEISLSFAREMLEKMNLGTNVVGFFLETTGLCV